MYDEDEDDGEDEESMILDGRRVQVGRVRLHDFASVFVPKLSGGGLA